MIKISWVEELHNRPNLQVSWDFISFLYFIPLNRNFADTQGDSVIYFLEEHVGKNFYYRRVMHLEMISCVDKET